MIPDPFMDKRTMSRTCLIALSLLSLCGTIVAAELSVTLLPSKTVGEKVIVPLALKNGLPEKVESARAVMFLFDGRGKVVGQSTHWIIGGETNRAPLLVGGTNTYQFIVPKGGKEFVTNRLTVTHVKLASGKTANPVTDVQVRYEQKP
jgi:hypothetical protein